MSVLFATVAVVCTLSQCNDYVIDQSPEENAGKINTIYHNAEYQGLWQDEKGLTDWLKKYQIGETIFEIVSIDIENQTINADDIP